MTESMLDGEIKAFFATFPLRQYSAGEVLIQAEAQAPLPVFYLVEGLVGQYDVTSSGNRMVCNIFKSRAFFPMSNALNDQPSKYFFEALSHTTVHVAPSQAVTEWLEVQPLVVLDLLARVYRGTDGLIGRMMRLMSGTAASRVAYELWVMAERFGEPVEGGGTYMRVTESQLASQTGLARETISRELTALKKQHIVELQRGGLVVHLSRLPI